MPSNLEPLPDVTGEFFRELGPVASYNRCWRAGLFANLLVKRGWCWFVPSENKAALKAAVRALPRRPLHNITP